MLEIYFDVRTASAKELSMSNVNSLRRAESMANSLVLMWTFTISELQQTFYSQRSIQLAMSVVVGGSETVVRLGPSSWSSERNAYLIGWLEWTAL